MSATARSAMGRAAVAGWIGGAALVQTLVLWRSAPGWHRPDLLLAVALAHALVSEPRAALGFAFAAGLTADLLSCGVVGLHAATSVTAAWLVVLTRSVLFAHRVWVQALLAFVAASAAAGAHIAVLYAGDTRIALAAILAGVPGSAAACALVVPLVAYAMGGARACPALAAGRRPEGA